MRAECQASVEMSGDRVDVFRDELNALVNVRHIEGDIRRGLEFIARCHIHRIVKIMEEEYKEQHSVSEIPEMLAGLMRTRAHLNYARHCACLMKDVKLAAFDPEHEL